MSKKYKWINKAICIIVLLFLISLPICGLFMRMRLRKNHKLANGVVTECRFLPKSGGSISIEYRYLVNKKMFTGSANSLLTVKTCDEHFLNKTFPVVYHPDDNGLSNLLFTPAGFKAFNYSFPDSLKWVLPIIEKED